MPASISGGIGLPGSSCTVGGPTGEAPGSGAGGRAPGGVVVSSRSVKRLASMPMITPNTSSSTAPAVITAGCRVHGAAAVAGAGAGAAGPRGAGAGPRPSSSVSSAAARVS
jgi:hypothetical protein